MKMKRGQVVAVYQKPITEEDYEGVAKIISIYPGDYDKEFELHLCKVQFVIYGAITNTLEDEKVIRRIKAKHIVDVKV
jgi:hypothetical protein